MEVSTTCIILQMYLTNGVEMPADRLDPVDLTRVESTSQPEIISRDTYKKLTITS